MSEDHQDSLISIQEQKLRACDELLHKTQFLKTALENGEEAKAVELIGCRDDLIRIIDELDRQMARSSIKTFRNERSAQIYTLIAEYIRQIASLNRECEAKISLRCKLLQNELAALQKREEAFQGYATPAQRIPKFLNIHT